MHREAPPADTHAGGVSGAQLDTREYACSDNRADCDIGPDSDIGPDGDEQRVSAGANRFRRLSRAMTIDVDRLNSGWVLAHRDGGSG